MQNQVAYLKIGKNSRRYNEQVRKSLKGLGITSTEVSTKWGHRILVDPIYFELASKTVLGITIKQ